MHIAYLLLGISECLDIHYVIEMLCFYYCFKVLLANLAI